MKKIDKFNRYGWYSAAYCKSTGLPMFQGYNYHSYANIYLSQSRCEKIGKPVLPGEEPVAFYRVYNGYCALYKRDNSDGTVL